MDGERMSMIIANNDSQFPPTNEHMELDVNEHDNNNGKLSKYRGINRPCFARDGAENIEFNPIGQAVEPAETVAKWQRYIGLEAVDHTLLGIDVLDWRQFGKDKIDAAWNRTKKKIDWTDPETKKNVAKIRNTFEKKLNDRWKGYKHALKKDWKRKYRGTEDHYKCSDDRVSKPQWIKLVDHWETDAAKTRAAKNKNNRGCRRMNQTTGTTTYAQLRHKYKKANGGASPSRCTMFELTHLRKEGTPIDEASDKAIRDMKNKIKALEEKKRVAQMPEILSEVEMNEVYADVLGKEKSGLVRGFGLGVRREDIPGIPIQETRRGVRLEVEALRAAHDSQMEKVRNEAKEREDKIREEMQKDKDATMDQMNVLKRMIKNQQAAIVKLLGSANPLPVTETGCNIGQPLTASLFDNVYRVPNLSCIEEQQLNSGYPDYT